MFKPKFVKDGELLLKGVNRFIHYRRDLLKPEKLTQIEKLRDQFSEVLKNRNQSKIKELTKKLTEVCEGVGGNYRQSALAENIEVIFVAIAIALGIRSYVAQPFKIPTGSMEPTLNGIVANNVEEKSPNYLVQLIDLARYGRTYENVVIKEDDVVVGVEQRTNLKFFTATVITTEKGHVYKIRAPIDKAFKAFNLHGLFSMTSDPQYPSARSKLRTPVKVDKGLTLARGYVDTGDQVIVDKFSYHFFPPRRGEVFVFTTKNTPIAMQNPNFGSIHYIKRLCGVPHDQLMVSQPKLMVNGNEAEEYGIRRVMSQKDGYDGYFGRRSFDLAWDRYVALGDNSDNSSDSRMWGTVPKDNLTGRALFVYWPFNDHWGIIR